MEIIQSKCLLMLPCSLEKPILEVSMIKRHELPDDRLNPEILHHQIIYLNSELNKYKSKVREYQEDYHYSQLEKLKIEKEIQNTIPNDKKAYISKVLDNIKKMTVNDLTIQNRQIPYMPGEPPNSESKRFHDYRLNKFSKWILETQDKKTQSMRFEYGCERKDALDSLQWCVDLLTYLKFLPKNK